MRRMKQIYRNICKQVKFNIEKISLEIERFSYQIFLSYFTLGKITKFYILKSINAQETKI